MAQYFFRTRFKGTHYHGWQIQENAQTVQGVVNQVLRDLFRTEEVRTLGCGRTDKGVHAEEFYFAFWTEEAFDLEELRFRMNNHLPDDIAIRSIYQVSDEAQVRFDPEARSYIYRIHREKDPFLKDRSWFLRYPLDPDPMREGSEYLMNCRHFGSFARSGGNTKTDICDLERVEWEFDGERVTFRIDADRFLRGMVRAIVGTMIDLGRGKFGMKDLERIVASRDREQASGNAPAHGLSLHKVRYPYTLS